MLKLAFSIPPTYWQKGQKRKGPWAGHEKSESGVKEENEHGEERKESEREDREIERRNEGQRPWKKGVSDARDISVRGEEKEQWITKTSVLLYLFSFLLDLP